MTREPAAHEHMKAAIVIFPGSNREHDVALAWKRATGSEPARVWHREAELPDVELIILPAGLPMATTCAAARWRRTRR